MANISKFKDKKTGEVYDLGPKTWEIALTGEQFAAASEGDAVPTSEIEGLDAAIEQMEVGDNLNVTSSVSPNDTVTFRVQISVVMRIGDMFQIGCSSFSLGGFGSVFINNIEGESVLTLPSA